MKLRLTPLNSHDFEALKTFADTIFGLGFDFDATSVDDAEAFVMTDVGFTSVVNDGRRRAIIAEALSTGGGQSIEPNVAGYIVYTYLTGAVDSIKMLVAGLFETFNKTCPQAVFDYIDRIYTRLAIENSCRESARKEQTELSKNYRKTKTCLFSGLTTTKDSPSRLATF